MLGQLAQRCECGTSRELPAALDNVGRGQPGPNSLACRWNGSWGQRARPGSPSSRVSTFFTLWPPSAFCGLLRDPSQNQAFKASDTQDGKGIDLSKYLQKRFKQMHVTVINVPIMNVEGDEIEWQEVVMSEYRS